MKEQVLERHAQRFWYTCWSSK